MQSEGLYDKDDSNDTKESNCGGAMTNDHVDSILTGG